MTDTFARMRQLIGTTAEWTANDLIVGQGEIALERIGGTVRLKVGDGVNRFSALPYFDPGIFDYVLAGGDTMTGPLVVPVLSVTGAATVAAGLTVTGGASSFAGAVTLGPNATTSEPASLADNSAKVPTTHWVQQQVGGIITGLNLKGTWNAATNTPALASGGGGVPTPVRGDFYIVSVAGTTTLDGISVWNAGDSVVFNGVSYQRVPQTLAFAQIVAGLGYTPVNKAGDTMSGDLLVRLDPASANDGLGLSKNGRLSLAALAAGLFPGFDIANLRAVLDAKRWRFNSRDDGSAAFEAMKDDLSAVLGTILLQRDGGISGKTEPAATSNTRLASTQFVKISGATAQNAYQKMSASVPFTSAAAYFAGPTTGAIGAAGEKWRIQGTYYVNHPSAGIAFFIGQLWDGAAQIVSSVISNTGGTNFCGHLCADVTLAAAKTFTLRAQNASNANGEFNSDSWISAVRLG